MATFVAITEDQEADWGQPNVAGDQWANSGHDLMVVGNAKGIPVLVRVFGQGKCSQGEVHHYDRTVSAAKTRLMGPFDRHQHNQENGFALFQLLDVDGTPLADTNSLAVFFVRMVQGV